MSQTVSIAPLTRIEGHLDIEAVVDLDQTNTREEVASAKSSGTMFRGFEMILQGRDPMDAPHYTQRICGVCPTSHGMAASMALESAMKIAPPNNGRILRNLILGADFLQSHILHFYQLALPDYVDLSAILPMSPWAPGYSAPDMLPGTAELKDHYIRALTARRQAHQMGAIFGGKMPCSPRFGPGGCMELVSTQKITDFRSLLSTVTWFITNIYLPDVDLIAARFPDYLNIGRGCGNLLAYGVFDLDATGTRKLLARGRYTGGVLGTVDPAQIVEYVKYSSYSSPTGKNPSAGSTVPQDGKAGAYSWIKAPRYMSKVHEVGPLARMWVNGDYRRGISVIDRLRARALETQKIALAMADWLNQLVPGRQVQAAAPRPASATGIGLTEAPRGAVGHWVKITNSLIANYQIISPTGWNASPKDDLGQSGPIEQALVGTPVADTTQPVELLRVVHSFDPCLACSVHAVRPRQAAPVQ